MVTSYTYFASSLLKNSNVYHRMLKVESWTVKPGPLLKQGHPEQVGQGHIQTASDYP